MSLIFVLGNIGGALAASVLPASMGGAVGAGAAGAAGAGTAALGGTGAALGGAGAAGAAGTTTAGLFGGTSLAGLAGAPTGIAAGAGPAAGATGVPGEAAATAAMSDKAALAAQSADAVAKGTAAATPATPVAPGAASALPTTGSSVLDSTIVGGGLTGAQKTAEAIQTGNAVESQNKGYRQLSAKQGGEEAQALKDVRNTLGGGLMLAEGGGVNLQSGQFVIPADIVSDLGNGDTKAGMEFLKQFFETGGHA